MMFFKGLLLIHFERVRCIARAEVDETSLDWNRSLIVPVVYADARRAGGRGARFDGDGDGYVRIL